MKIEFQSKSSEQLVFRELNNKDEGMLSQFFEKLSEETRSRFGPHDLTKEQSTILCKCIGNDNICRFVILTSTEIIGYFILDFNSFENEISRYLGFGIELNSKIDPVFAPCIIK